MSLPSVIRHMAVGALMLIGASAQGAHQLAYSKSMGVTVFAEGDAQWCDQQLQLTIDADNAGFFASPELQRLLQVLGTKVLANDCALAEAAQIEGRYQGATVWQGSTSKRGGWAVEEMATEKPAVVEVPAGQALLQAAADDVKADPPLPRHLCNQGSSTRHQPKRLLPWCRRRQRRPPSLKSRPHRHLHWEQWLRPNPPWRQPTSPLPAGHPSRC